ncbi:MAG: hypothetical protein ACRCXZ_08655, partial [Patescibacteria group bacterium]
MLNNKDNCVNMKSKIIIQGAGLLIILMTCFFININVRSAFETALTEKLFEIPKDYNVPSSLKSHEKVISTPSYRSVQTFEIKGNDSSDKNLIIYPGLKGVFHYVHEIATNPRLLNEFKNIITFNYPSQGKTEGKPYQESIIQLGQELYNYYSKNQNLVLLCLSNGAVPCTHITTQSNTKIKLVHPFLSSTCIFENIFNGY